MIRRKRNIPAYREYWYSNYRGETPEALKTAITEDGVRRKEIRRRIEDVQEGMRLDEVFSEVWD